MSNGDEDSFPGGPPASLLAALRRLLRPLIRLLVARGVTYGAFAIMAKALFVEIAETEFPVANRRQTDSRISLLTGVHRKDVKRLRRDAPERFRPPPVISLHAQLIALWAGAAPFMDDDGKPRPLPRHGGESPSFETLVRSVSRDIRPRAVLDEWLRLGIARIDSGDQVHLDTDAFVPREGFDELAYYFGRNLHDHIAVGVQNLLGDAPPLLERSVYYDRLTPESVAALARLAETVGMEALLAVNREALARAEADDGKPEATERMNFGLYYFHAPVPPKDADGDEG